MSELTELFRETTRGLRDYTDSRIAELAQATAGAIDEAIKEHSGIIAPIQAKPVQLIAVKRNVNGNQVYPTWSEYFDTDCVTVSGTTYASEVGEYEMTVTPNPGCAWEDGSTESKTFKWYIVEDIIPSVPAQTDRYFHGIRWDRGEEYGWDIYSENGVDGKYGADVLGCSIVQTGPSGKFPVKWSLKNPDGEIRYAWWDGTIAQKIGSIDIEQYVIPKLPEQSAPVCWNGGKSYMGAVPFADILDYGRGIVAAGTATKAYYATELGTHEVAVQPEYYTKWWDGTSGTKYVTITVDKLVIPSVPQQIGVCKALFNYSGANSEEIWDIFALNSLYGPLRNGKYTLDVLRLLKDGTEITTYSLTLQAGTYTITWELKDLEHMEWWDGTTGPKTSTLVVTE